MAGFLVFIFSLVFGMGGYTTNESVANDAFDMAFWAGMPAMAVATFGIITWAQRKVWMANIHVFVSLIILGIGVYTAYFVSVLDMKVGYETVPGLIVWLQISLILYTLAAFFAFWGSYATVFIIQEMREDELMVETRGTGTELDKQLETKRKAERLPSEGQDAEDCGEKPGDETAPLAQFASAI